ncbi:hypothetical protein BC833DRAFT_603572 [Globomyces pollinis-pini]|nr:hypothetical protein BC833DRAFT_603572 [Globomyces pollinis-pini]
MLKFITKVTVGFSPLVRKSKSARTFISRLWTKKNALENPKFVLDVQVNDNIKSPFVQVLFADKKEMKFDTSTIGVDELVADIKRYSKRLQLQEDIANSS